MDKTLIRTRFARAAGTYLQHAEVQHRVAEYLAGLIGRHVPGTKYRRMLEIGCGTGLFTRICLSRWHPERLWLNDLCPEVEPYIADLLGEKVRFVADDAENLNFPSGQDLIVSCSVLQWFAMPERFLIGCRRLLSEGGYLALATYGRQNMKEVGALTSDTLPYRSLEELSAPLSDGYELVCCEEEIVQLSFDSPLDVLRHLKRTGVTGIRSCCWTKGELEAFSREYIYRYAAPGGTVPLTYHPIYLIMCKR